MKKNYKKNQFFHTPDSSMGMGDNYGSGIKQKMGTVRENMILNTVSKKSLNKPPKSLA